MHASQRDAHFALAGFVLVDGFRRDQQLIEGCVGAGRLIGKIAPHGRERHEDFVDVPSVVTGVLLLLCHDSNHGKRKVIQINRLAHRVASGKQLLRRIGAEECNATAFAHVAPIVKTADADV